ncbi:MAG: hypothetical protein ACREEM_01105, partial [Blastocatellia bacterium]
LIALIGVIVPQRLRADWRQEWEAELRYRETIVFQKKNSVGSSSATSHGCVASRGDRLPPRDYLPTPRNHGWLRYAGYDISFSERL